METAMVVGGCWPAIETALVVLLASNGYSHGKHFCWPTMETAMVVGGCWPAMDAAMELMVVGQQGIQPWNTFVLASNGDSHGGGWLLARN